MDWVSLLANWGPMLLLIVVWVFFMLLMMRRGGPQSRALTEQKRHNDTLEKILANLDARLQKLEDDKRQHNSN